jgi:hypothetical protein
MNKYKFNFNQASNLPKWGLEEITNNIYLKLDNIHHINNYYIDNIIENRNKNIEIIDEDICLLLISTTNAGHTISEIISFINYYTKNNYNYKIGIYNNFIKTLPYLYELLLLFFSKEKIIIFYNDKIYHIKNNLYLHRNYHFNYLTKWDSVDFIKTNDDLIFNNIEYTKNNFICNTNFLFDKVSYIYENYKDKYNLLDNIMIIKFNNEKCITPQRGFDILNNEIIETLNKNNINIININNFLDINHYICQMYHAKNIIFSYGATCCTNRFFINEKSNIIILCNLNYKLEWDFNNDKKNYWHIRHSHLIPVKKQTFLLEFENYIDNENINRILKYIT